jgi:hypothetical protein
LPDVLDSIASSQRHDFVGGDGDIAESPKAVHESLATRWLCGSYADNQRVAAAFHFDLSTGANAEFIAKVLRNGELTLFGDSHEEEP